jgi:sugar lactone lactonase YvrE
MANKVRAKRRVLIAAVALLGGTGLFAGVAAASPAPSITTVAGTGVKGSSGDGGPAVKARLNTPAGVAEDLVGTLYVSDPANNTVRKIVMPTTIQQDIITTIAGTGASGFFGDGGQATSARLSQPAGVAVDSHGNVFIADTGNNRVRRITTSGIISTVAGNGDCRKATEGGPNTKTRKHDSLGDGGPATSASLCRPMGIAPDSSGDLFIADTGHDLVRKVLPDGTIVAFAGIGKPGRQGNAHSAADTSLKFPTGVVTDTLGHVYIADSGNNEVRIANANGVMSTFAGTGKVGFSGDGGLAMHAKLHYPTGLGVDPSGNVFVADTRNDRIRQINTSGIISTYAGTGRPGFSGDGGPATMAQIKTPTGDLAADGSAVYFADTVNRRVRGIFTGPAPVLPQSDLAVLLPVSGGLLLLAILAGGLLRRRFRKDRKVLA